MLCARSDEAIDKDPAAVFDDPEIVAPAPPDSSRADEFVRRMTAGKRRAEALTAATRDRRKPSPKKSQMNFYVDSAVREAIRRLAFERRCSMTEILNDAVREYAPEHVRQAEIDLSKEIE